MNASEQKVQPALTPGQWRLQLGEKERLDNQLGWAVAEIDSDGDLTRHALAALALHGQPFGFTWQDVRLLREAAARVAVSTGRVRINPALSDLADRIAALLPPEEE